MTEQAKRRVLVTATGGDLGQSIVKALRLARTPWTVYGCDCAARAVGAAYVGHYAEIPAASSPDYLSALDDRCATWQIDALIPASEAEMRELGALRSRRLPRSGAVIVAQSPGWFERYGDKLTCMEALSSKVPLAPFADGRQAESVERLLRHATFPFVVKPRRSSGSRQLAVVESRRALERAIEDVDAPLVQQWFDDSGGEFSVGAFVSDGDVRTLAFRRQLGRIGATWYAETVRDPEVETYARAVAAASELVGAANIQVRKSRQGVRLLEINARFSSLVAARAACNFRDVEWSLALALGQPFVMPQTFGALRFQRVLHELLDTGAGFVAPEQWAPASSSLMVGDD